MPCFAPFVIFFSDVSGYTTGRQALTGRPVSYSCVLVFGKYRETFFLEKTFLIEPPAFPFLKTTLTDTTKGLMT